MISMRGTAELGVSNPRGIRLTRGTSKKRRAQWVTCVDMLHVKRQNPTNSPVISNKAKGKIPEFAQSRWVYENR
jgi:hypothetical protein